MDNRLNLVLIGNGFDRAHGPRTGYREFVIDSIESHLKDRNRFNYLMNAAETATSYESVVQKSFINLNSKNPFFIQVCKAAELNWCDIETLYFKTVESYAGYLEDNLRQMTTHNEHFLGVITALEEHLST